ncbi:AraC family transcriptional regulator ligand-binding domain-containing protein [Cupriavidus basilensis]
MAATRVDPGFALSVRAQLPASARGDSVTGGCGKRLRCLAFAALMVERRKLSDIGAISLLLRHQRSARAAIGFLMRHKGLLNDVLAIQIESEGQFSVVRIELVSEAYARQAAELGVGVIISIFQSLLGEQWRPHEIYFSHAAPEDLRIHRRVFRSPLRFGAEYSGFACLTSDLDSPSDFSEIELKHYEKFFLQEPAGHQS